MIPIQILRVLSTIRQYDVPGLLMGGQACVLYGAAEYSRDRRATLPAAVPGSWPGDTAEKSIAVLAFENMSADPENTYFGDGIAEDIINALTQLGGLRVAARTSAFAFKGKRADLRRIGETLNVATVLEGSVRKTGTRLRITAQLINVADSYHLWSERYDRQLTDVFAIQDEIATAIAGKLQVTFAKPVEDRPFRRPRGSKPTSSTSRAGPSWRKPVRRFCAG